ncbi:hypothetical protein C1H46_038922 [Malus baccata]|uniref:Uncharacterized protein n=1 Tax=Malus baccata TaxID=106549 RepID=A0A540KMU9_MALBA|nr:hypothetical protein C1H46_038922 [Malus baccata]
MRGGNQGFGRGSSKMGLGGGKRGRGKWGSWREQRREGGEEGSEGKRVEERGGKERRVLMAESRRKSRSREQSQISEDDYNGLKMVKSAVNGDMCGVDGESDGGERSEKGLGGEKVGG